MNRATTNLTLSLALLMATTAMACQVPVFRFALERWSPDRYRVVILSNGPLDENDERLRAYSENAAFKKLASVDIVDVSRSDQPRIQALWKKYGGTAPVAIAFYPEKAAALRGEVAHATTLSGDHLQQLFQSSARTEISKRLAQGQSAVWVLLACGDADKDQAALRTLKDQLEKDAQWLKLPSAEEMEIKPEVLQKTKIPLRIEFSTLVVNRQDAREKFLVDCLLGSESDLRDTQEPIAFPIFGRGMVLYALVGKGIAPDTIRAASTFISGPCSCQVKEQNPGFDLLMDQTWDALIGETLISSPIPESGAGSKLLKIPPGRRNSDNADR